MKPKREYLDFLKDIADAAGKAERFTEGMDAEGFAKSEMTVDAVARALEIIGEAAKNIPPEVKERHPGVPWKRMAGLRDVLAHGYFAVDLSRVWAITRKEIPALKTAITRVLEDEIRRRCGDG